MRSLKKVLSYVLAVVITVAIVGVALPNGFAFGQSPTTLSQLVPFIRSGGGVPTLFDAQSTGKGELHAYDLGVNEGQLGIVFGYGMEFAGLSSGQWTIADDGTISGGGCAMAVLEPGWYPMYVILDGRYEIYNLPGISQDSWQKKLVAERIAEQGQHYGCSYTMAEVEIWNPDGTASPFLSAVTASAATTAPAVAPAATAAPTVEAATAAPAATVAPAAERRLSGENQTIDFAQGESVYGWKIQLDNGYTCDLGECYLITAPAAGKVTSGVVNPSEDEISSIAKGNPWEGQSNRQPAG